MSAQERDDLAEAEVRAAAEALCDRFHVGSTIDALAEGARQMIIEDARVALAAAQKVRTAGGEVEAAPEDVIERAAESLGDYLQMLGVDPDEVPEHGGDSTAVTLVRVVAKHFPTSSAGGVPGRSEAEIKAEALREAADEMEAVIADGDVAAVAAPVSGEVGRSAVVRKRDALYEEPHEWLREWAARVAGTTEAGDE